MYGIVVWSISGASTAIIWCADNKDLVYVPKELTTKPTVANLCTGDLVWITCQEQGRVRYCTSFTIVEKEFDPFLAGRIHQRMGQAGPGAAPSIRPNVVNLANKNTVIGEN